MMEVLTVPLVVLRQMYRSPQFCARALQTLDRSGLMDMRNEPEVRTLWAVLKNHYIKHRVPPTPTVVGVETRERAARDPFAGASHPSSLAETVRLWQSAEGESMPDDYVAEVVDNWVWGKARQDLARVAEDPARPGQALEEIDRYTRLLQTSVAARSAEQNPFVDTEKWLKGVERFPCGMELFDRLTGGGPRRNEAFALVMPQKAGKTTVAMQLAKTYVERGEHVAHLSFEQPLQGDIALRSQILASDGTRHHWESGDVGRALARSADMRRAYDRNAPLWRECWHFNGGWVEPKSVMTGVADAFDVVRRLADEGKPPKLLIIDWWGRMQIKLEQSLGGYVSDTAMRKLNATWLGEIKSHLAELVDEGMDMWVLVLQQVAGDAASRSARSGKAQSGFDVQGDKSFGNMFDFVAVSSVKRKDDTVEFNLDAARSAASQRFAFRLDAQKCLFVPLDRQTDEARSSQGRHADAPTWRPMPMPVVQGSGRKGAPDAESTAI